MKAKKALIDIIKDNMNYIRERQKRCALRLTVIIVKRVSIKFAGELPSIHRS